MRQWHVCGATFGLVVVLGMGVSAEGGGGVDDATERRISFQALLTDDAGVPLPGPTVDLGFTLYTAAGDATGPTTILSDVPVAAGIVDVQFPVDPSTFDGTTRYLGVIVDSPPELSPRLRLSTVPHALRVQTVESAELADQISLGTTSANGSLAVHSGSSSSPSINLAGNTGQVTLRAPTTGALRAILLPEAGGANFILYDGAGTATVSLRGDGDGRIAVGGEIKVESTLGGTTRSKLTSSLLETYDTTGQIGTRLGTYCPGALCPVNLFRGYAEFFDTGGTATVVLDGDESPGAALYLKDGSQTTIELDASGGGGGAGVTLFNSAGSSTVIIDAEETPGAALYLKDGTQTTIQLDANGGGGGAGVTLSNSSGAYTIVLDADESDGGSLLMYDGVVTTTPTIDLDAESGSDGGGDISLYNSLGKKTLQMDGDVLDTSKVLLYRSDGTGPVLQLRAEVGGPGGDSRVVTQVLEITGGADLSEQFDVDTDEGPVEPGMVVSIDPSHPGKLVLSKAPYDHRVAGIISGAGGVKPGMLMAQAGSVADGKYPVALTGRVYVRCDASHGPIQPGDLLTTSKTPGHAMKVTDHSRAHGAVLGKAMTSLEESTGLVLVLVNLQ